MAIQVLNYKGGAIRASFDRSPVVALFTDSATADGVPAELRSVADRLITSNVDPLKRIQVPEGCDGTLVWLEGDELIEGNPAMIRKNLREPGRRTFVPVQHPYLAEADLITLQPRSFARGKPHDYWGFNLRIANEAAASERALVALRAAQEPWAQLSLAVAREATKPGTGAEALAELWQSKSKVQSVLTALALRNLAVVLMRHERFTQALELLERGSKAYEGYAELPYLAALLCLRDEQPKKALTYLQRMSSASRAFVGSGGESTYRLSWLLGLCELRAGDERKAFRHFMASAGGATIFMPAAEEMLKLRVPRQMIEKCQWALCRLARRKPQLLDRVFEYLLLHRAFPAARRLTETLGLGEERRGALIERLDRAMMPFSSTSTSGCKPGVILEGPFLERSSLARINREIAMSLIQSRVFDVALDATGYASRGQQTPDCENQIVRALNRHPECVDLTTRHQWPPDFSRPARGKLAVILPWEYGAVPEIWVDGINRNVDELWVPSRFVRDVLVRSGVARERIVVIPNGVDLSIFNPKGPTVRPAASRKFMFLFVGGVIRRKGIDLLLEAYREAFNPGDDVSLLVAALGSDAAYQHNSLLEQVMSAAQNPALPHLELLTGDLDDATLANLYRGCDAFVLPYRAEGFCMPALEAMACGKPVITTAAGPSQDFCSPATTYLVPARECRVPEDPPAFGKLRGEFTWFEEDLVELVRTLRRVYHSREEAARRGLAAAEQVRARFAWQQITRIYRDRIAALTADWNGAQWAEDASILVGGLHA
jgi:glycosyltransferase involved in cell wall biosynthesis